MDKKYQVFLSSTFSDLIEERQAIIKSILDMNHIPSSMEAFPAADIEQIKYIKKVIDVCDYYVLIIGCRYGSVNEAGVSYTELEYDYAKDSGKTILAFICGKPETLEGHGSEQQVHVAKLEAFRKKVSHGRLVNYWNTRETLRANVIVSLSQAITQRPAIGWVRGDAIASEAILAKINELRNMNDDLVAELKQYRDQESINSSNVAGLDDPFLVRFKKWQPAGRYSKSSTIDAQIEITWANIFRSIAPSILSPVHAGVIGSELVKHIRENMGVEHPVSIFTSDQNTIKVQLASLGLVEVYSAVNVKGGMSEFMVITEAGKLTLAQIATVRRV